MARKDYPQFAAEIVAAVGGKENIVSVTNCMTRLRFVLADEGIVKDDEVKKIKGVMGVVHGGGQYQIPIGTQVADLCPEVEKLLGTSAQDAAKAKADSLRVVSKDSWYNRFFKAISGCIIPSIAPVEQVGRSLCAIRASLTQLGYRHPNPIMSLGTLGLPVSPALKLTDRGLVDVKQGALVPLVVR